MSKKSELLQELSGMQREKEERQKRRAKLQADLEGISTKAEALNESISTRLLGGDVDVSKDRATLASLSVEESTLRNTITRATEEIRLLDTEIQEKENGIKMQDFLEVKGKAEALFLQSLDKLEAALPDLEGVEPIYGDLRLIAPIDLGGDHARIMQQSYEHLRRVVFDGQGLKYHIDEIRSHLQALRERNK